MYCDANCMRSYQAWFIPTCIALMLMFLFAKSSQILKYYNFISSLHNISRKAFYICDQKRGIVEHKSCKEVPRDSKLCIPSALNTDLIFWQPQ